MVMKDSGMNTRLGEIDRCAADHHQDRDEDHHHRRVVQKGREYGCADQNEQDRSKCRRSAHPPELAGRCFHGVGRKQALTDDQQRDHGGQCRVGKSGKQLFRFE
jgi:hypothetical protein